MSIIYKIKSLTKKVSDKIEYNRKVDQTIKELSSLSDMELNDIGIARGNIEAIARGANRA